MILRLAALAAGLSVLALQAPRPLLVFAMLPLCAGALALAAAGRGQPWTGVGALALAGLAVGLAGPDGLRADAAASAAAVAASVVLPSRGAPSPRHVPVAALWAAALLLLGLAVWLPARIASSGSPAPLDPATGAGLAGRSMLVLAAVAAAAGVWSLARWALARRGPGAPAPPQA